MSNKLMQRVLFPGKMIKAKSAVSEKMNNVKPNVGTIGNSLSASHNFQQMIFAMIQKKQTVLMSQLFFEPMDKLKEGILK
jgi:hypothetical protein